MFGTSQTASMLEAVSEHVGMRGARSNGGAASPPVTVAGIDALAIAKVRVTILLRHGRKSHLAMSIERVTWTF